ncbi:hypothetical protein W7K_16350 [Stenotrophomonas geniculata N1]|uniref:Uncharacterized protein n=1 Tax=Stenotrophomonas geniculata N1 TaxID=1167641 RepID=A0A0L8A700_9GAMM|nr:hypothetical protein W7K_16350 [Stenotrophomonas geniculata N1]
MLLQPPEVVRPGCARHPPKQRPKQQRASCGRRGGSAGGGRRKPFLGGLTAASMPRTPPPADPPRLRQFPAICRGRRSALLVVGVDLGRHDGSTPRVDDGERRK